MKKQKKREKEKGTIDFYFSFLYSSRKIYCIEFLNLVFSPGKRLQFENL